MGHPQCLGQRCRAHLFYRVIILWLPRLVEIQHGVGAQADGADGRVVQWSILMGLGSGHQRWAGQESTPPTLWVKGALPSWDRHVNARWGMWLLRECEGG